VVAMWWPCGGGHVVGMWRAARIRCAAVRGRGRLAHDEGRTMMAHMSGQCGPGASWRGRLNATAVFAARGPSSRGGLLPTAACLSASAGP